MQPVVRVADVRVFVFVPVDAWQEAGHTTGERLATTGSTASWSARPLVRLQVKRHRAGNAKAGNATNRIRTNAIISVRLGLECPGLSSRVDLAVLTLDCYIR
eukprot:scaffold9326_cov18-Prasinocladus_malaysianus.AAC.2